MYFFWLPSFGLFAFLCLPSLRFPKVVLAGAAPTFDLLLLSAIFDKHLCKLMTDFKLYDKLGNQIKSHDHNDRATWYETGSSLEQEFLEKHGKELGYIANPEKLTDVMAVDMVDIYKRKKADLKTLNTPLFIAHKKYHLDPRHTVTFTTKDRTRYNNIHKDVDIVFWVDWKAVRMEGMYYSISIEPLYAVYVITMADINALCEVAILHNNPSRVDVVKNSKAAYLLDVRMPQFTRLI